MERAEHQVGFVGGDPGLDLVARGVDRVAEVLGGLVDAADLASDPQVAAAAARQLGAEVQIAAGGDRKRPLVDLGVVDRGGEALGVAPRAVGLQRGDPDVVGGALAGGLARAGAVGDEVDAVAVGRDVRVGVAAREREWRLDRRRPAAAGV